MTRSTVLNRLDEAQRAVTRGHLAERHRRESVFKLWVQGYSQRAIAEILSAASIDEGGPPISENVVHKLIRDIKRAQKADRT